MCEKKLTELEDELDKKVFFRANRQNIINVNSIKSFRTFEKVNIKVEISAADTNHVVIISQGRAPLFRTWIQEA